MHLTNETPVEAFLWVFKVNVPAYENLHTYNNISSNCFQAISSLLPMIWCHFDITKENIVLPNVAYSFFFNIFKFCKKKKKKERKFLL